MNDNLLLRNTSGFLKKTGVAFAGLAIIVVYFLIFVAFFPNAHGNLGNDYAIGVPMLLSGYFWFIENGLRSVFWFTPSLCGGIPAFAHPINLFYSVPQFLTFSVDPLKAVILTFLLFAAAGFWGYYFLFRRVFGSGILLSFFCSTLFLFNGFYTYRLIIGHLGFHSFMLVPWCVLFLLAPGTGGRAALRETLFSCMVAGIMMAYMLYSAMQTLLPPVWISIVAVCLISGIVLGEQFQVKAFIARLVCSCMIAVGLSAAKLSAMAYLLKHMPRNDIPLPQFSSTVNLFIALAQSLFFHPAWKTARTSMVNMQYVLKRHEFEFGVTFLPLLIIGAGLIILMIRVARGRQHYPAALTGKRIVLVFAVLLLLLLPVALNLYSPEWSRLLKTIPVIKSSSQFTRWFCLYIPVIILITGLIVQKVRIFSKYQTALSIAGILIVIGLNAFTDKDYYHDESYHPWPIVGAYYRVKHGQWEPAITHIAVCTDSDGRLGVPISRNDSLVLGQSQLFCYDSMFGYGLEHFPIKQLEPGPVFKEKEGILNIKNPVCYVFSEENGCLPGDHFTVDQKKEAYSFSHYRPYPFKMPFSQKAANGVTLGSLILAGIFLVGYGCRRAADCRTPGSRAHTDS